MKLVIRKKTIAEWVTLFILAMPFLLEFLISIIHLPEIVKYLLDVAWICLLLMMIIKKRIFVQPQVKYLLIIVGLFACMTLVGFILHFQTVSYYLWGIRNNMRFYVFFFACIFFVRKSTAETCLRFFDILFWVNFPIVLYQYFVMGKEQDFLGGIFGIDKGCNGEMNIFLLIVITRSILLYLNKKEKTRTCFSKWVIAIIISILSELKVFFIEMIIVMVLALMMTRFTWKKFWLVFGMVSGIYIGAQVVAKMFPDFSEWFSLERIWRNLTKESGYTMGNDMNRLTTVSIALNNFLPSVSDKLFGLGLGNCDHAGFEFLITPFYAKYKWLNYTYFSSAFLVLETGLIGLTLYTCFFGKIFYDARRKKRDTTISKAYCQMGQILALMCVVLIIYNSSLRAEIAYVMYFALALPYIMKSENMATDRKEKGEILL